MRWERLFADLEAEAAEMEARARDAEIAERTRAEIAAVRWLQRLRGATGTTVSLAMAGAGPLSGRVRYVGPDWVLVDVVGQDVLVPAAAVLGVTGLGTAAPPDVERVPLTWAAAWRTLTATEQWSGSNAPTGPSSAAGLTGSAPTSWRCRVCWCRSPPCVRATPPGSGDAAV